MRRQFLLRLLASAATLALVVAGPVGADGVDHVAPADPDGLEQAEIGRAHV